VDIINLQTVSVLLTIVTLYAAIVLLAVRWMMSSGQKHSDEKFKTLSETLTKLSESRQNYETRANGELKRIEMEMYKLRAELPEGYVRREDFIRVYNVTDAKLDSTNMKLGMMNDSLQRLIENQRVKEIDNV